MSEQIEYAEIRLNDGDGNDYINFYVDGITHSYLLEEVYELLNGKMPCGHLARYAVNGEDGTQYCSMCALRHVHLRDHKHEPSFCDPCKYIGKIVEVTK